MRSFTTSKLICICIFYYCFKVAAKNTKFMEKIVGNRVTQIISIVDTGHHIKSEDICFRGYTAKLWWYVTPWLQFSLSLWPKPITFEVTDT